MISPALMKEIGRVDEMARGSNAQANTSYTVGKLPAYTGGERDERLSAGEAEIGGKPMKARGTVSAKPPRD